MFSALHDDRRAYFGASVQIGDVVIGHANAPGRNRLPDRIRLVRAVNTIKRARKIHSASAQRIIYAAFHVSGQIRATLQHLRGRRPIRPLTLIANVGDSSPRETGTSNADAISKRLAAAEQKIKAALARADDDRSRRITARPTVSRPRWAAER
jgi:hypothetical protein